MHLARGWTVAKIELVGQPKYLWMVCAEAETETEQTVKNSKPSCNREELH